MKMRRWLLGGLVVLCAGAAGFVALSWRSEIDPISPPSATSFNSALIAGGASLAAIGDCAVCHTNKGGDVFAGGLPLPTPFGTIYSTNITPDPETGIGQWSEAAFVRAMREGVARDGKHLYPAFPYDHFTKVSDEDDHALYAYLMTRKPVRAQAPVNDLPFPINIRMVLAGWKLLFLRPGAYQPDATQTAEWNRGAYLVDGLGHCGACHTPRNLLGAEKGHQLFAGGESEGWTAYALNAASPAPVPWNADSLAHYLGNGWEAHHGVARGPMAPVAANLGAVSPDDANAIATYLASIMGDPATRKPVTTKPSIPPIDQQKPPVIVQAAGGQTLPVSFDAADKGAAIYATACSSCHEAGRPVPYGGLHMGLSSAMNGPTPANPINVILSGLPAAAGERGPIMPGFAGALTDQQIAELLTYMRSQFSDQPPWEDAEALVSKIRQGRMDTAIEASSSGSKAPANSTTRETSW
jgi:mono/diheme cytochrome c family protein